MHWGFLALVFFVSIAVGAGVSARKQYLARRTQEPPKDTN